MLRIVSDKANVENFLDRTITNKHRIDDDIMYIADELRLYEIRSTEK